MLDNELWINWISFSVASLSEIQQGVRAASCAFSLCSDNLCAAVKSYCGDSRLKQVKTIVNLEKCTSLFSLVPPCTLKMSGWVQMHFQGNRDVMRAAPC